MSKAGESLHRVPASILACRSAVWILLVGVVHQARPQMDTGQEVMMPELDGYEVLKLLRKEPVTATIPFIFLSAKADKSDLRQGMQLGADDYLTKPFTASEFPNALIFMENISTL